MRNPSANAVCITMSARPGTIIEIPRAALQRTAQRRCHDRLCISIRCDCQRTDMTPGGDVGVTGGTARVPDPNRAHREAAEQKLVMQISAKPEQRLIDPANPFASRPFARF